MNDGRNKVLSFVVSFSIMRSRERLSTLITRKSFAWGRRSRSRGCTARCRCCPWTPSHNPAGTVAMNPLGMRMEHMWRGWVITRGGSVRVFWNSRRLWRCHMVGIIRIRISYFRRGRNTRVWVVRNRRAVFGGYVWCTIVLILRRVRRLRNRWVRRRGCDTMWIYISSITIRIRIWITMRWDERWCHAANIRVRLVSVYMADQYAQNRLWRDDTQLLTSPNVWVGAA